MEEVFEEYLKSKNIDSAGFAASEPDLFTRFKHQFLLMHPESFTMQKKFFINDLRRRYLLRNFNTHDNLLPTQVKTSLPDQDYLTIP